MGAVLWILVPVALGFALELVAIASGFAAGSGMGGGRRRTSRSAGPVSTPPPLPPPAEPPGPPPPSAVRAESLWEFHADERIVEAGFGADGRVRVVDALGTFTLLDSGGRPVHVTRTQRPLREASLLPGGGALLLPEGGRLQALDELGAPHWETALPGARCVGGNARVIGVGAERHPVRTLSPAGAPRAECVVEHPVAHVAAASAKGHLVALSPAGQFGVVLGAALAWRLHLRSNATSLSACDAGLFAIAHREGAQVFTVEGSMVVLFDVGRPLRGVALSGDAPRMLLLDDQDGLHLVDLSTGFSTWRETRPRSLSLVRLSRDGSRALAVSAAGTVELLGFQRSDERAARLETTGVPRAALWRHVAAAIEDVAPSARFTVDPAGTTVAVAREDGARIELHDATGTPIASVPGTRDLLALQFSSDGAALVQHGRRVVVVSGRDGRDRIEIAGEHSHVLCGPGASMVLVGTSPPRITLQEGRRAKGTCDLPGAVTLALASPDLSRVVAVDATGRLTAWASGHAPWRRPHEARAGSVAIGGPSLLACEGDEVVGLRADGSVAWTARPESRVELLAVGDGVLARDESNRFLRFGPAGEIEAVDAGANLGRSIVAATAEGVLELNVRSRVLTAFRLDGGIAWRCEAPAAISSTDLVARRTLLAFRAGTQLGLLPLGGPAAHADAAGRATFLEL